MRGESGVAVGYRYELLYMLCIDSYDVMYHNKTHLMDKLILLS